MKTLITIIVLMLIIGKTVDAQDLSEKLNGEWRYSDDMECPDFILIHSSGRYIIFNDCGSITPQFPIIEKGDWTVDKQEKKLILAEREFVSQNSVFSEYHGEDKQLTFLIEQISDDKMTLCFNKGTGDCVTENYSKVGDTVNTTRTYKGIGSHVEELILPLPKSVLKLVYKSRSGSQLVVEDQDKQQLFRVEMVAPGEAKEVELLLADLPNILNLKKLLFKVKPYDSATEWKLKVAVK